MTESVALWIGATKIWWHTF